MRKKSLIGIIIVLIILATGFYFLTSEIVRDVKKEKVYRIGVLSGLNFVADITDGFKEKMTDLGYIEGKNVIYDVQKTDFDTEVYKKALQKFVDENVDLIVSFPTEASLEAKKVGEEANIPVVFTFALIEGMGLVDDIRQPGGNITGVRYPGPDIAIERLEIMMELAPEARRFLIPYQRGYPIVAAQLDMLRSVAETLGITLVELPADNAAEIQTYLDARSESDDVGFDAILIIIEPLGVTPDAFKVMAKFAYEHKLPIGGALISVGDYKSIFGVNVNNVTVGKQTAPLVDKVFRGIPAGTIPVVSAESYFQIDYTAAQKLGVKVPESLLGRADEVIR